MTNTEEASYTSDVYDLRDLPYKHYRFASREGGAEDVITEISDKAALWEASLRHPEGGVLTLVGLKVGDVPNVLSEVGE